MRDILFRGKRVDNGEWVYGQYAYLLNARTKDGEPIKHMIVDGTHFGQTVDSSTVGQYTGLTDKNGVKIFEGDIVEGLDFSVDDGYGVVSWDDGGFLVFNGSLCGSFVENYKGRDFEVIGNIHDNRLEGDE